MIAITRQEERLALAVELRDHATGQRPLHPVSLRCEGGERLDDHGNGLFVLRQRPRLPQALVLSSTDPHRRYVPRRLQVALPTSQQPLAPLIFPGCAYPISQRSTGLRGALQTPAGAPLPFCRVVALSGGQPVAWAHGDDRGEFLLLLPARAQHGLVLQVLRPLAAVKDRRPPLEALAPGAERPAGEIPAGYRKIFQSQEQQPLLGQLCAQTFVIDDPGA